MYSVSLRLSNPTSGESVWSNNSAPLFVLKGEFALTPIANAVRLLPDGRYEVKMGIDAAWSTL